MYKAEYVQAYLHTGKLTAFVHIVRVSLTHTHFQMCHQRAGEVTSAFVLKGY